MAARNAPTPSGSLSSLLDDLVTIGVAAKTIGMSRYRVRELAIKHRIAIRWGGTDEHPRLKVRLSEMIQAIMSDRYYPLAKKVPAGRRAAWQRPWMPGRKLHPLVTC